MAVGAPEGKGTRRESVWDQAEDGVGFNLFLDGWPHTSKQMAKEPRRVTALLPWFHSSSCGYHQFQSTKAENVATKSTRVSRE